MLHRIFFLLVLAAGAGIAQSVELRDAPEFAMPAPVDSNSPAFWRNGRISIVNSWGTPLVSRSGGQLLNAATRMPDFQDYNNFPLWIEAVWFDEQEDILYAWYHHEPGGVCGDSPLTAPKIGALVSTDGGRSFIDLGIVLTSGYTPNCDAKNGFFAGGHGDFSVILDPNRQYFYFLFDNYGGPLENQGVSIARMAFEDRKNPVGSVWKYYNGNWSEPGLDGQVTPMIRTRVSWGDENTDSFWGPSVHWNTKLQQYVILLNHACCSPGWPQEGIYISFVKDLADPGSYGDPKLLIKDPGYQPAYYPQILGVADGETDTLAGERARLWIKGISRWELVFQP